HHAVGVDRAAARSFLPFELVAEAERAVRARIEMHFAAGGAFLDQQLALRRGIPEGLGLRVDRRGGDLALLLLSFGHRAHSRSMITVAPACLVPSEPPVPCASATSQLLTCTAGWASPRNWRTASNTLVNPPRFDGWLLHSPP